jgi:hypothetical protein
MAGPLSAGKRRESAATGPGARPRCSASAPILPATQDGDRSLRARPCDTSVGRGGRSGRPALRQASKPRAVRPRGDRGDLGERRFSWVFGHCRALPFTRHRVFQIEFVDFLHVPGVGSPARRRGSLSGRGHPTATRIPTASRCAKARPEPGAAKENFAPIARASIPWCPPARRGSVYRRGSTVVTMAGSAGRRGRAPARRPGSLSGREDPTATLIAAADRWAKQNARPEPGSAEENVGVYGRSIGIVLSG